MFFWRRTWKHIVASDIQLFKLFLANASSFSLVIVIKAFAVDENLNDDVALAALYKVIKLNTMGQRGFGHIH